jgi:hypothetical protein
VSEEQRERIYFRMALAGLLVSPWIVAGLLDAGVVPGWDQTRFLVALLLAMPATFLLEIVITALLGKGPALRFWVKHPSVRCEHEAKGSVSECEREVRSRLQALGFSSEPGPLGEVRFSKPQRPQVSAFLDHAFTGRATLAASSFGTRIAVELTFADILLLETGERGRLAALGDYICLRTADGAFRGVPLLVYCGVTLGFATALASSLMRFWPGGTRPWLFPTSAAAAGFLAFAVRFILRDRQQLFGYRLAALGLALAALPWIAWLLRLAGIGLPAS